MSALLFDDLTRLLQVYDFNEHLVQQAKKVTSPDQLLTSLLKEQAYSDSVAFLAHCFKKEYSISWGYLCLVHTPALWSRQEANVLEGIDSWLKEPVEKHRRSHEKDLHHLGVKSPVAWLGQAIFWSGGSITPEDAPAVDPSPSLFGQAVSGAVQLAALVEDAMHTRTLFPRFINLGIKLIEGMHKDDLLTLSPEEDNL
ncbi:MULTISPECIES: hypothetical protein [Gammaproteobacteria]|uniref:DUF6931 family protein n=1 Tax=Gammaproteobacteria TaxID=1236 RepID=UPI001ADBB778|nr:MULTISPECIES: hypothetical protein [Gammaproteobacteria]MBO9480935.1 hypothetical protein [Salinisphaera sp. G21_0]MBO9494526.1 hypothetical protein [Thalassotalea sp. G20_0]